MVLGACLAENGNDVICVDKDAAKIATLEVGEMPIYEPGLGELVLRNHSEERLTFTTDLAAAVRGSDIAFIAVGTPQGEDGSADLQHVLDVARDIGRAMTKYMVVVDKSTVPVGTAKKVHAAVAGETAHPFSVVSNPEFLKQGAAIEDFMKPDRVVIGVEAGDTRAADIMRELYGPFTRTGAPILMMDSASAELSKYAANSILATRISFMNEMANVCELTGANVDHVRKAIGADRRIGSSFLFPGVGYGGSCFPKDTKALLKSSADKGYEFRILRAVEGGQRDPEIADRRQDGSALHRAPWPDDRDLGSGVQTAHRRHARGAGHRDHRAAARTGGDRARVRSRGDGHRAPPVWRSHYALREELRRAGGRRRADDRDGMERVPRAQFRADASSSCAGPVVFDGRNIYSPEHMRALGFTYVSIGR